MSTTALLGVHIYNTLVRKSLHVKMLPPNLASSTDLAMNYVPCIRDFSSNNYRYSGIILSNSRNLYSVFAAPTY
jgi:hypothetical protein